MFKNHHFKYIALLCVTLLAAIAFWGGFAPKIAFSQQFDASRLNNLEFDVRAIESRLDRIESQLGRPRSPRTPVTQSSRGQQPRLSREQMFDRLATLVIELKQQVNQLEQRVSQLEPQVPGKKPRSQ
jgi:uncharacterized protein YceH (UPF0502 family)